MMFLDNGVSPGLAYVCVTGWCCVLCTSLPCNAAIIVVQRDKGIQYIFRNAFSGTVETPFNVNYVEHPTRGQANG